MIRAWVCGPGNRNALWRKRLKTRPDYGASVVVGRRATACLWSAGKPRTGRRGAALSVVRVKEEHTVQQPNALFTTLGNMAQKPAVRFDKLFQKLYNVELWLL